jgi:deoxycytidylate deaminase
MIDFDWIMKCVVDVAKISTCKRSKCGSIIVATDESTVIGQGYNSMPCNERGECFKDGLPLNFKSDKTCCVHAEQRAIMDALENKWKYPIYGSSLFFIRLDENDNPMHAGEPYCTICSKMALDVGISKFYLWHKEGWVGYDTKEYNELSFKHANK